MKKEKLVSIIMPAYNASHTIAKSIDSVLRQTYDNWELLVVNDHSKDNTENIVSNIMLKDDRVRLVNQTKNKGVAEARNKGIELGKGDYIAFLDSDDMWTIDKLEKQINFMEMNNYKFTYANTIVINEKGEEKGKRRAPTKLSYSDLLKSNHIACLTVVLSSKVAKENKMKSIGHEDYLTWLEITKSGLVAYNTNLDLGFYRVMEGSLSSNKVRAAKWQWNIYRSEMELGFFKSCYYFINYLYQGVRKSR